MASRLDHSDKRSHKEDVSASSLDPEAMISVSRDGRQLGSWPLRLLSTMVKIGEVKPTDFYWTDGLSEWRGVNELIQAPQDALQEKGVTKNPPPRIGSDNAEGDNSRIPGSQRVFYTLDGKKVEGPISTDELTLLFIKMADAARKTSSIVYLDFLPEGTDQWKKFSELPDLWMSPPIRARLQQSTLQTLAETDAALKGRAFAQSFLGLLVFLALAYLVYNYISSNERAQEKATFDEISKQLDAAQH